MFNKLRYASLFFYSFIILMGWMSPIPLIIWLIFTIFDFGNSDNIFAILGIIGLFMQLVKPNPKTLKKEIVFYLISFVFLISPVIKRILAISIENYNYLGFIIPLSLFIILYKIAIIIRIKKHQQSLSN
ncbi:hypothetical protein D3C87_498440 [compost metagenome]